MNQRAALPPFCPLDSVHEHFHQAVSRLGNPLPTERAPILDLDLEFAAEHTARSRGVLRGCVGALRELKRRWKPLTQHLRQFQLHVMESSRSNQPGASLGRSARWVAIPHCANLGPHWPGQETISGKQRVIDDAAVGGQSQSDPRTITSWSCAPGSGSTSSSAAFPHPSIQDRPDFPARFFADSEDLPDAYRHCPMSRDEARACLVVWHHKYCIAPAFQLYSGREQLQSLQPFSGCCFPAPCASHGKYVL